MASKANNTGTVAETKLTSGPRRGITLYTVDGFNFDTREEAEDFASQPWPRTLSDGSVITSDRVKFPASRADQAEARQTNIGSK